MELFIMKEPSAMISGYGKITLSLPLHPKTFSIVIQTCVLKSAMPMASLNTTVAGYSINLTTIPMEKEF